MKTNPKHDAFTAVNTLCAADVERRLDEIEAEETALRALLRSLKARDAARRSADARKAREHNSARVPATPDRPATTPAAADTQSPQTNSQ